jgi:hypothetical protein
MAAKRPTNWRLWAKMLIGYADAIFFEVGR